MEKGTIHRDLKNMSPQDQRGFSGWLTSSAIVGSIFAAATIAMALAGSFSAKPPEAAIAKNAQDSGALATVAVSK
jgi:hypothetical protein